MIVGSINRCLINSGLSWCFGSTLAPGPDSWGSNPPQGKPTLEKRQLACFVSQLKWKRGRKAVIKKAKVKEKQLDSKEEQLFVIEVALKSMQII